MRATLWNIRAYPCTGLFVFLTPFVASHSALPRIVSYVQTVPDGKVLDVGCYIGHDLRALQFAGVPQGALHGLDVLPFWEQGWELFNDREKFDLSGRVVVGDVLDFSAGSEASRLLDGRMDVVWSSAVLHQFAWDKQVVACKRLLRYTKGRGSFVFGCLAGSCKAAGDIEMERMTGGGVKRAEEPFKHDKESFERLWGVVGEEVGMGLEVEVRWTEWGDWGCEVERARFMGEDMGVLEFTVRIV